MIKRKIILILLAVVLVFGMAMVCSAAMVTRTGTDNGCTYAIVANCEPNKVSAVIEYQGSQYGDYNDYMLQTYIEYSYTVRYDGITHHFYTPEYSIASTRISGITREQANIDRLIAIYYINANSVHTELLFPS